MILLHHVLNQKLLGNFPVARVFLQRDFLQGLCYTCNGSMGYGAGTCTWLDDKNKASI